jgi:hypothetical protein
MASGPGPARKPTGTSPSDARHLFLNANLIFDVQQNDPGVPKEMALQSIINVRQRLLRLGDRRERRQAD